MSNAGSFDILLSTQTVGRKMHVPFCFDGAPSCDLARDPKIL